MSEIASELVGFADRVNRRAFLRLLPAAGGGADGALSGPGRDHRLDPRPLSGRPAFVAIRADA